MLLTLKGSGLPATRVISATKNVINNIPRKNTYKQTKTKQQQQQQNRRAAVMLGPLAKANNRARNWCVPNKIFKLSNGSLTKTDD